MSADLRACLGSSRICAPDHFFQFDALRTKSVDELLDLVSMRRTRTRCVRRAAGEARTLRIRASRLPWVASSPAFIREPGQGGEMLLRGRADSTAFSAVVSEGAGERVAGA